MKDSELRGIVLQKLYDFRVKRIVRTGSVNFDPVPRSALGRILEQLRQHGLVDWRPTVSSVGAGNAKITAKGVDVIEGTTSSPIAISIDQSQHISFSNSNHNILGDRNAPVFDVKISELFDRIEKADVSEDAKIEAKNVMTRALEHPLVSAIVGGATSALLTPRT